MKGINMKRALLGYFRYGKEGRWRDDRIAKCALIVAIARGLIQIVLFVLERK